MSRSTPLHICSAHCPLRGRPYPLPASSSIRHGTRRYATRQRPFRLRGSCRCCPSTGNVLPRRYNTNEDLIAVQAYDSYAVKGMTMSDVVYVSKSRIERKRGPLRIAYLPGESQPVTFSVHGAIAAHYKVDPAKLKESHYSTIDYVISATAASMM